MKASIADLELLAAVAREGNFRRAALALGLSPSSATERIRALEGRVGARLLNRSTRSVSPTEAGAKLLTRLSPVLEELASALAEVSDGGNEVSGTLRINSPPPATQLVLAPLISRFLKKYPQVVIDITSESGFVDIVRAGYDAGVRYEESLALDMIAVPLSGPQALALVASPALIERVGLPQEPQALLKMPCIRNRYSTGTLAAWEFKKGTRTVTIRPDGPLTTSDPVLALHAAMDGIGFYATFEGWARAAIASGRLVSVLQDWLPPTEGPFLYFPSRRNMPAALRAFVDFIRSEHSPTLGTAAHRSVTT